MIDGLFAQVEKLLHWGAHPHLLPLDLKFQYQSGDSAASLEFFLSGVRLFVRPFANGTCDVAATLSYVNVEIDRNNGAPISKTFKFKGLPLGAYHSIEGLKNEPFLLNCTQQIASDAPHIRDRVGQSLERFFRNAALAKPEVGASTGLVL